MRRFVPLFAGTLIFLAALVTLACGGRQLQSVALSPTSAEAQNFPNGQVPFAAKGTFSSPPSPVTLTSKDVVWCVGDSTGACPGNINTGASVDLNGLAQCNSGFVGTATILAGKVASTLTNPDGGSQLKVFGSAQLTCP